jgi:hypothetical protein
MQIPIFSLALEKKINIMKQLLYLLLMVLILFGCSKKTTPPPTNINDDLIGVYVPKTKDIYLPPGMVLINQGKFNHRKFDNSEEKVTITVDAFMISRYEETNLQYRTFLDWLINNGMKDKVKAALPDTKSFEQLPKDYFKNTKYNDYPVVGLTIDQIHNYLIWKTIQFNELMIKEKKIKPDIPNIPVFKNFNDLYEYNEYLFKLLTENGIDPPGEYRLPTEVEWCFAFLSDPDIKTKMKHIKSKSSENYPALFVKESKEPHLEELPVSPVYYDPKTTNPYKHANSNVSEWYLNVQFTKKEGEYIVYGDDDDNPRNRQSWIQFLPGYIGSGFQEELPVKRMEMEMIDGQQVRDGMFTVKESQTNKSYEGVGFRTAATFPVQYYYDAPTY